MLFTNGTNGIQEVQSIEELKKLVSTTTEKDKISIWLFNSNEWISFHAFLKIFPDAFKEVKEVSTNVAMEKPETIGLPGKNSTFRWPKKIVYITGMAVITFLVFNFTKMKQGGTEQFITVAARPANVPLMDMDSLVTEIETARGQVIDKNTKANLRMRNTWPERILLQLKAEKEKINVGFHLFNIAVSVDNTTGFAIDNAIVKISVWKNDRVVFKDTLAFNNIGYSKPLTRNLDYKYKGDSLSVSFETIKAKAFKFCYAAATKNNSGNYNDRWFCRQ